MTDAELDTLIEAARPSLRVAMRNAIEGKQQAMMFSLGQISFANKQSWSVSAFVLIEPLAALVQPMIMTGIPAMLASQMKPAMKPSDQPSPSAPPRSSSGGLSVPGID